MSDDRQQYIQELEERRDSLFDKIVRTVCTERKLGSPEHWSAEQRAQLERDAYNLAGVWSFAREGAEDYPNVGGFLRRLLDEYDEVLAELAEQESSGEAPYVV